MNEECYKAFCDAHSEVVNSAMHCSQLAITHDEHKEFARKKTAELHARFSKEDIAAAAKHWEKQNLRCASRPLKIF